MKNNFLKIVPIIALVLVAFSCKKEKKAEVKAAEEVVEVIAESKFKTNPEATMIHWKANKIVGGHEGTINASSGILSFKGDQLVGGSFIFDIKSLKNTDIPADDENNAKLVGHLLNADFFDAENHPNAAFEITEVVGNNVKGNLTIKGIKKNIEFSVKVTVNGDEASITSDTFTIDRTEWDIKYNSGKFADAAKLGDYLIKDDVELSIMVKANKA